MTGSVATVHLVDAFTAPGMAGNPAGVCVLEAAADPAWMQSVAAAVGYSETAFAHPRGESGGVLDVDLRWFTPTVEIDLCGHATLATTAVLARPTRFATRSGVLDARPIDGGGAEIVLPGEPLRPLATPGTVDLESILGSGPVLGVSAAGSFLFAEVPDRSAVDGAAPDMARLKACSRSWGVHGVVLVARLEPPGRTPDARGPVVCASRVFAPAVGIPEDPVTGSAHAHLAHRFAPPSEGIVYGEQRSARGGIVGMSLDPDRPGRVALSGAVSECGTVEVRPGAVLRGDAPGPSA